MATLESSLCRGLVLRLTLDSDTLNDPDIITREKYAVVLNNLCPDDPTYFVLATSNIARFTKTAHLSAEIVELDPTDYPAFLNRRTALDLTDIKALPLKTLERLHAAGQAVVVGQLTANDMTRCDDVIRKSRFIAPRITHLILPGAW